MANDYRKCISTLSFLYSQEHVEYTPCCSNDLRISKHPNKRHPPKRGKRSIEDERSVTTCLPHFLLGLGRSIFIFSLLREYQFLTIPAGHTWSGCSPKETDQNIRTRATVLQILHEKTLSRLGATFFHVHPQTDCHGVINEKKASGNLILTLGSK